MVQVVMKNMYVPLLDISSHVMMYMRSKRIIFKSSREANMLLNQKVVRIRLDHFSNSLPLLIFFIKQVKYLSDTYYLPRTGKSGLLFQRKSKIAHKYYPFYCFLTFFTISLGSFLTNKYGYCHTCCCWGFSIISHLSFEFMISCFPLVSIITYRLVLNNRLSAALLDISLLFFELGLASSLLVIY